MSFSFSKSTSITSGSNIKGVNLNGLEDFQDCAVTRFYFSQRVIEDCKILNVRHAYLVLELEHDLLITAEVTGTSFQDVFVSFRYGGEPTSTAFDPNSNYLSLREIMSLGRDWSEGVYDLAKRNCYHFVHGVLERFAAGDIGIILQKLQDEWTCKIKGIGSLATLAIGALTGNSDMIKYGAAGYISGLIERRNFE